MGGFVEAIKIVRMNNMIKLIASDIDGTLVPDGTAEIDPRMFDVIKKLKECGIIYVGASGRQFASMARLFAPVCEDIYYITPEVTYFT